MSRKSKKKAAAARLNAPVLPAGVTPEVADSRPLNTGSGMAGSPERWLVLWVCVFLAAMVWLVFGQTLHHEFVNYDDDVYVYQNPEVARGLTLQGIVWAFTHAHASNWHPLTWISHMLDCQLYGLNPGGHHFTNVLLHTATVILLFLVLRRMTGFLWRSAFVAAVFAIHPLRVESVAWVAERKDVLSGLFFMLTLWAYGRYVQRRSRVEGRGSRAAAVPTLDPRRWTLDYFLVLLFFALGLMSKPMLVTLPLVLLLLDYWPLERFKVQGSTTTPSLHHSTTPPLRLLLEKLPLFGLAAASCVVTIYAQTASIQSFEQISLPLRVENALISYVAYLGQMFWPSDLTLFYPFTPGSIGISKAVLSFVVLAGISAAVYVRRRRCPCFLTGWLWYLIMLVPVIGLVQVGDQIRADRYTYLPQIGLYLMLTWAAAELCAGWRYRRVVLGGGAAVILAALISCACVQAAYWRDSESLWTHTLACTSDNYIAQNNLGVILFQKEKGDEAMAHYQKALQIKPGSVEAHYNLGNALLKKGQVDEAIAQFQKALQIKPNYVEAHNNLGEALLQKGRVAEAITHFQKALQIEPNYPEAAQAHYNLGNDLKEKGRLDEAMGEYQKALQIKPGYTEARINLGNMLNNKGRLDEAMVEYQKALQIKPDSAEAHYNLGNALYRKGRADEAMVEYQKALQIEPDNAEAHNNIGNALFQKGRVDEAMVHYQQALQIKPDYAKAHINLGDALLKKGGVAEAITHFQKALQINPDNVEAQNTLAWVLATAPQESLRNGPQAVKLAQQANQLVGGANPIILRTLAVAYAEVGQFPEAVETAQRALQLAETRSNLGLADAIRSQLKLYQAGLPFHYPTTNTLKNENSHGNRH